VIGIISVFGNPFLDSSQVIVKLSGFEVFFSLKVANYVLLEPSAN